jgi:hypothetical protein
MVSPCSTKWFQNPEDYKQNNSNHGKLKKLCIFIHGRGKIEGISSFKVVCSGNEVLSSLICSQNLTEKVSDNLTSPEQPQPLPEEDMVVSLLGSVVTDATSDDNLLSQQQAGDGQILCVTYIVNPTLDEVGETQHPSASEISQRMVLHVADDGTTLVLPAENVEVGAFDIESGLVPLTVNSLYSLATNDSLSEESLTSPLVLTSDLKNISKEEARLKNCPFIEINDRRRTEQVC